MGDQDAEEFVRRMLEERDTDFESATSFLQRRVASRRPPENIDQFLTPYDEVVEAKLSSNQLEPGDITSLIQNVPGTLGFATQLPEPAQTNVTDDQPDLITTECIPIFLGDKYFHSPAPNEHSDGVDHRAEMERTADKIANASKALEKNEPHGIYPTIYASDKKRASKVAAAKLQKPELFNSFEIYQLKRVSSQKIECWRVVGAIEHICFVGILFQQHLPKKKWADLAEEEANAMEALTGD